ncbi:MAG: hypothetical protein ACKVVP_23170 [Chloroflexota bacterium]
MKELKSIDISTIPETLRLAREVARTGVPVMLKTDQEDLAVLTPAARLPRRSSRAKPLTIDDPLFGLIGIGRSKTPGGVSERKQEALARAYRPTQSPGVELPRWLAEQHYRLNTIRAACASVR